MSQPVIDPAAKPGTDTDGRVWVQALVDNKGRVLAGRDEQLNFHCFVDSERLFDEAMTTILYAQGVDLEAAAQLPERSES